jgi:hypothetical protein
MTPRTVDLSKYDITAMRLWYGSAPAWTDEEVYAMYTTYVGLAPLINESRTESSAPLHPSGEGSANPPINLHPLFGTILASQLVAAAIVQDAMADQSQGGIGHIAPAPLVTPPETVVERFYRVARAAHAAAYDCTCDRDPLALCAVVEHQPTYITQRPDLENEVWNDMLADCLADCEESNRKLELDGDWTAHEEAEFERGFDAAHSAREER